jgi:hypothetical protein
VVVAQAELDVAAMHLVVEILTLVHTHQLAAAAAPTGMVVGNLEVLAAEPVNQITL